MLCTFILVTILSAASSIAHPYQSTISNEKRDSDTTERSGKVRIVLGGSSQAPIESSLLKGGMEREEVFLSEPGPYASVELITDEVAKDLRCEILRAGFGTAVTLQRHGDIDDKFDDQGAGPWTFVGVGEAMIESIVCDPSFPAQ